MSFASYPQHRNFFYQEAFCEVASHIWQKTCQDENRAYFIDKDQPILCPLLHQFDDFFGNQSMKHNVVSHKYINMYRCTCKCWHFLLREIMLTTLKMGMNAKANVNGFAIQILLHSTWHVEMMQIFGDCAHLFLVKYGIILIL
jgi:hypothetical protein